MPSTKATAEGTNATDNANFELSLASKPFLFVIGKEKREFHVHKEVIGQLSPALSALVNGITDEGNQGRVEWPDLDDQTFVRFAKYAYSKDYVEAEPELLPYDAYSPSDHATSQQNGVEDGVNEGELDTADSGAKSEKASIATPPTPPPHQEPRAVAGSSGGSSGTVSAVVAADVEEHEDSDGNEVDEDDEAEEEEDFDEDEDEDEDEGDSGLDEGDSEEEDQEEKDDDDDDDDALDSEANANTNTNTPDIFQSAKVWSSFNFSSSLYSFMQHIKASHNIASSHHHQIDDSNDDDNDNDNQDEDHTACGDTNGKDAERRSPQLKKRRRMNSHTKPRRNHKYETIDRFANLTTPSMHAQPSPANDSLSSSSRNSRSSASPHSHSWHPRKNIGPRESYEQVFLSHARLYLLAEKYAVQPLRTLTLYRLHKSLLHFTIYQERIPDLVKLAEEIYDNTDEDDEARAVVSSFFGCIIENVRGCKEFSALVKRGGAFADDLVLQMVERLD